MSVTINGVAAATLGFEAARAPGSMLDLAMELEEVYIPGRQGKRVVTDFYDDQPRDIVLEGDLVGTTVADLRTKMDMLLAVIQAPTPTVLIFADTATRQISGTLVRWEGRTYGPQMLATRASLKLTFRCHDPFFYDVSETSLTGITSYTALPMGTAIVRPRLTISAGAVNPTISLRDHTDTVIQTMDFAAFTPAGAVIIDCDAQTIMEGVVSRTDELTGGDFLKIDPRLHANFVTSDWPTITISAGSLAVAYRRTWR